MSWSPVYVRSINHVLFSQQSEASSSFRESCSTGIGNGRSRPAAKVASVDGDLV